MKISFLKYWVSFSLVFLLFLNSCRERSRNEENAQDGASNIHFSFSDLERKQSELFTVADVIKLETNDSSLIGDISTIISKTSGFYVADFRNSEQIIKFDPQGNFLFAVNKKGRGVGEFLSIYGVGVDKDDKFLYLYDAMGKRVMCYDAKSGDYIRHFPFKYNGYSFSVLPDGKHFVFYCSFAPNNGLKKEERYPNFVITDSLGEIKKTFAYFDAKIESSNIVLIDDIFSYSDSNVYCFTRYNDIVFKIDKNIEVTSAYMLDYLNDNQARNKKLLEKVQAYDNIDFNRNKEDRKKTGIYELTQFNFTERFMYFTGVYGEKQYNFLYDKVHSRATDLGRLIPDVIGTRLYFIASDKEYFYIPFPIAYLQKAIIKNHEAYDLKIKDSLKDIEEDANPLIVKIRING